MAVNLHGLTDDRAVMLLENLIADLSSVTTQDAKEVDGDALVDAELCRTLQRVEYESQLAIIRDRQIARELQRTGFVRQPRAVPAEIRRAVNPLDYLPPTRLEIPDPNRATQTVQEQVPGFANVTVECQTDIQIAHHQEAKPEMEEEFSNKPPIGSITKAASQPLIGPPHASVPVSNTEVGAELHSITSASQDLEPTDEPEAVSEIITKSRAKPNQINQLAFDVEASSSGEDTILRPQFLISEDDHDDQALTDASSQTASPQCECVACGDQVCKDKAAHCICDHAYCQDCLTKLFSLCLHDESLFPPRCCSVAIPIDEETKALLGTELSVQYQARKVETDTPAPQRVYCHESSCNKFIAPDNIHGDTATCSACNLSTCTACKRVAHWFCKCREDGQDDQTLLHLASEQGWRQCSSCKSVVELNTGCFHISAFTCSHLSTLSDSFSYGASTAHDFDDNTDFMPSQLAVVAFNSATFVAIPGLRRTFQELVDALRWI
ncbi:hypothetical protein N0V93_002093 [Gnomoniopsis smithogilvyi]|uniref:IBR domain-containing protein n=1 Tax=Gnomoniopsis smithogilvyi TaxID=1191159 RepID=A0A9W8Z2W4_9PEZI|nr:hypothetical protein N0V93_002093 [Gnomoniopsis smithogilvyi]